MIEFAPQSPCDTCRSRQRDQDPEGCSRKIMTTGFWGRLLVLILGCPWFGQKSE